MSIFLVLFLSFCFFFPLFFFFLSTTDYCCKWVLTICRPRDRSLGGNVIPRYRGHWSISKLAGDVKLYLIEQEDQFNKDRAVLIRWSTKTRHGPYPYIMLYLIIDKLPCTSYRLLWSQEACKAPLPCCRFPQRQRLSFSKVCVFGAVHQQFVLSTLLPSVMVLREGW